LLGAIAAAPAVAALPALPAVAEPNPDAELIAMDRERRALVARINASTVDLADDDPIWDSAARIEGAILNARPKTTAGIAIMLRVIHETLSPCKNHDGSPVDGSDWYADAVWKVIQAAEAA
jgi:hypothetical protein